MDAWSIVLGLMFVFPPTAILFMASMIKLWALLVERRITWRLAFAWATGVCLVLVLAYIGYLKRHLPTASAACAEPQ